MPLLASSTCSRVTLMVFSVMGVSRQFQVSEYLPGCLTERLVDDRVREDADAFDLDITDIARSEENRRFPCNTDARGRSGDDDVSGFQGHGLRASRNQRGHIEDHVARIRILKNSPIHAGPQSEPGRARWQLIGRDELR